MKSPHVLLLSTVTAVLGAVNLDGSKAVDPVSQDDPSPIADTLAYIPDQHDCPLPCRTDYANVHKWTPFYSVDRLRRCETPMLLHFSVLHPLDDPETDVLIRACALGIDPATAAGQDRTVKLAMSVPIGNPKLGAELFESRANAAPACAVSGRETAGQLALTADGVLRSAPEVKDFLDGMRDFFAATDNCDESFLFAYHKTTVAGLYIGSGLGKQTVTSSLQAVAGRLEAENWQLGNHTIAQMCDAGGRGPETGFGVSIDTVGDLARVQKTAVAWSRGECAGGSAPPRQEETLAVKVFDIASAPLTDDGGGVANSANTTATLANRSRLPRQIPGSHGLGKRAVCSSIRVEAGDGCASLAAKCGIRGSDFMKYNPSTNLCATLKVGSQVCCSAGDPSKDPKPNAPRPNADGSCAVHLIQNGDACADLADIFGLTVAQIESFNQGKTWGWTGCTAILAGYNMCLSEGTPPLPPPQQGTQCGPLVPGTQWTDRSVAMADLNPCPLKACCSNWGFCGPFPEHCDVHAPPNAGPGVKLPGFQSTCVSSCGNEIKKNSGAPANFSRIGYYGSWNMERPCLWLKADNANTDGSYTHIHWGFAEIDPTNWTVVLKDPYHQWQAFKNLAGVKRIVSFGGWDYSTQAATFNIIRQAIIANRDTFAANAARFVVDEGLDGIDIDWEYPGAPDIYVDGAPIGQAGDGVAYLRFLTLLKSKLPSTKSVSIAAPASYWYLKAFPIDRISAVIDYIVYMTYDLHGQWDAGNPNAFDACPSGRCIRSHVNLTETRNTLALITKAGVPNNKIFVGESSYGRSFHMAVDGCWGPNCDFTGGRLEPQAAPGRCTGTPGVLADAEINDIIRKGEGQQLYDADANVDVLLHQGDYISYLTPLTKSTRRTEWKGLNFGGTVDWALDLQAFGQEDMQVPTDPPSAGEEGCIAGESDDLNADALCGFACNYGFCPPDTCTCVATGPVVPLPDVRSTGDFMAWDEFDVDLQRLCKFGCKYGFCPADSCTTPVVDEWEDDSVDSSKPTGGLWDKGVDYAGNSQQCMIYKNPKLRDIGPEQCAHACSVQVEEAKAEGRTTNYGCVGSFPLDKPIPWQRYPGSSSVEEYVTGRCVCDNTLVNVLADTVIEALPIIAQIGCYIVMSTLKLILDIGLEAIPGPGKAISAGLDAAATAAQVISYAYPPDQNPVGAFEWWLSPCGGSDLVPDEIKRVFDILSTVADGVSSYKSPKNIPKGSGRKGDAANPTDRSKPKAGTGSGPNGTGKSGGVQKRRKCSVSAAKSSVILGAAKNTLRRQWCAPVGAVGGPSTTTKNDYIITSLAFGAKPTVVEAVCKKKHSQACFHYSSAIANNPQWDSLKCPHGKVKNPDENRKAVDKWKSSHHDSWKNKTDRAWKQTCDVDEFPPRYLLSDTSPEIVNGGKKGGQLMRYIPWPDNRGAGQMWKSACFKPHIAGWTPAEFWKKFSAIPLSGISKAPSKTGITGLQGKVSVDVVPSFRISKFEHAAKPPVDDGLWENACWPKAIAAGDPGFALWDWDPWYQKNQHKYDFSKKYEKGTNGA